MDYHGNDIYCDVIIPRTINIDVVKETGLVIAYHHTKPFWPVHIVITPKKHVSSLLELEGELQTDILDVIKSVASSVKDEYGACRVSTNLGDYQDSKHLHFHVSNGEPLR